MMDVVLFPTKFSNVKKIYLAPIENLQFLLPVYESITNNRWHHIFFVNIMNTFCFLIFLAIYTFIQLILFKQNDVIQLENL